MTIIDISRLGTAIFLFALGQHLLNAADYFWSATAFICGTANFILSIRPVPPSGV